MSVQTDAVICTEQCVQVDISQSTQWTQCIIDHTDQSVQAVCRQSQAAAQVAPQTSDAAIQTSLTVTEPPERLPSPVSKDKLNAELETTGHCQVEDGACIVMSKNEGEVADCVSVAQRVIDIIADSPTSHSASPDEQQLQQQEDCSGSSSVIQATTAQFNSHHSLSDTLAVHAPVTIGTASAVIEQQPSNQCDGSEISQLPAAVQKQFPDLTAVHSICLPAAVLQPSFAMDTQWRSQTATKYVYSFEQRTYLARSVALRQSSEVGPVSVHQSVYEASVTQSATQSADCPTLNTKPALALCSTSRVDRSGETATTTDASAALMPLVPYAFNAHEALVSSGDSEPDELSADCQCISRVGSSLSQSQVTKEQAAVTTHKQLMCSTLLPSLPSDVTHSASLPATELAKSSSHEATRAEESIVSEFTEQCPHPPTTVSLSRVLSLISATQRKFSADDADSGKLGRNSEVPGSEGITASTCEYQSKASESQASAHCFSSMDASSACAGSKADSRQQYDSKEPKAAELSEMSRLSDCSVTRGRRRPLFVHRGPLMEPVTTVGDSDSTSPHHRLHKDCESSTRKLPIMLQGMF